MATFDFRGRDTQGQLITGRRVAQSSDTLGQQLMNEGITPIHISTVADRVDPFSGLKDIFKRSHVSVDDLSMFSRQMYTLCKTGVPISSALKQLANNAHSVRFGNALQGIAERLEAGQDLAGSMQQYPTIFKPLMVSMIRVGQNSGHLDDAFLRLNTYLELEGSAIKNIKASLRYPMIVFVAVLGAVVLVNVFVIPTFAKVFKEANMELPWTTTVLIGISEFFTQYWYILLGLLIIIIGGIYYYLKQPQGKLAWHQHQLKIPVIGDILKRIILLRFAQSFAVIINSGISLIEGIELVADTINNVYIRNKIMHMQDTIKHGKNLTQAAVESELFTPLELQMFSVSEATGELASMLEQVALYHRREVEYDLKRLNDIIEPTLIVVLALVVLVLAFAVYLPIWNMVKITHV